MRWHRRATWRPHRGRALRPRAFRARHLPLCTRCGPPRLPERSCGGARTPQRPLQRPRGARWRPYRRLAGGASAACTTASAARTRRVRPCAAWTLGLGSAEIAAAAVGGARGGCEACAHAPVRFLPRGAHLARATTAGGGEVVEGGDVGGGDRGDGGRRAGAVGPPRGDLAGTCACS